MNIAIKRDVENAAAISFDGASQDARAAMLATSIGTSLDADLGVVVKAKQDWEGGTFKVMFAMLTELAKKEVDIDGLPEFKGERAENGNNPRFYKTRVKGDDGKDKVKEHDFYKVVAENLPGLVAKKARIDKLGLSMKDPAKYNLSEVPKDILDMPKHLRQTEISRLQGEVSTAKNAVVKSFELWSQIKAFDKLAGVSMDIVYAVDKDGTLMDGKDGRPGPVVENTRTPIMLQTKLEARKLIDYKLVGIGAFLKYPVDAIAEQGGSWQALEASVAKGTNNGNDNAESKPRNVNTVETALTVQNDFAEYLKRIQDDTNKAGWEAFGKALHGPGSDDAFLNSYLIHQALTLLVGSPKDQVRGQKLFNDMEAAA